MKSIAFTGHRDIYGYDFSNESYLKLKLKLKSILEEEIYKNDANTFITGGAIGFDTLAFEVCDQLIEDYGGTQILAIPFKDQPNRWNRQDTIKYLQMKRKSTCVYVDELSDYSIEGFKVGNYHPAKMQKRNEWMVDSCDLLIGCWNGDKKGGTYNCLQYAKKKNKDILIINPKDLEVYKLNK